MTLLEVKKTEEFKRRYEVAENECKLCDENTNHMCINDHIYNSHKCDFYLSCNICKKYGNK